MDIDLRQLLPLVIIGGSFAFTGTILYGAWLLGRYRGREDRTPIELANVEARLHRLEHVVAQTAGAVDRLEAAQRLTARLIGDGTGAAGDRGQGAAGAPRPPLRVTTPH